MRTQPPCRSSGGDAQSLGPRRPEIDDVGSGRLATIHDVHARTHQGMREVPLTVQHQPEQGAPGQSDPQLVNAAPQNGERG